MSGTQTYKEIMDRLARHDKLEMAFRDAVAKLPDYKRGAAWEFVKKLEKIIEEQDKKITSLEADVERLESGE